ncbi:hypothetical protein [Streptomyces geranii]|uniref:hypothetical protein n=1 Tax=Streptomyces geranii TaxID=2058923 RepID=UPI000D031DCA|nr:hypothetical protein [Streptomyces geranii]
MGMKDEMQEKARQAKEKMEQARESGQRREGQQGRQDRQGQQESPERGRPRDEETERAVREEEDRLNQDYDI